MNLKSNHILLVYPASISYRYILPPLGVGYIASALEGIGIKVQFIDCQITRNYQKKIVSLLPGYPVVGLSVNAGNVSSALEIARAIRAASPRTRIIMGGPHATAVYDKLIPEYADIVVRGEGEGIIIELMQTDDLSRVKGIAYWDGDLKVNSPRPYIEDLDKLKFPAWHLYELNRYRFSSSRMPLTLMITSRGCPYDCIYCTKFIHGHRIRFRSIENVMDEIDYMVSELKIKEILIEDDLFFGDLDRVKDLCDALIDRGYKNLHLALIGGIRPENGNQEIFNLLAKAGFYLLDIAVETGSKEVAEKLNRPLDIDRLKSLIGTAKKAGLKVTLYFMFGLPFDTLETMGETVKLAKSFSVDGATFVFTIPFAGTKLYEMVQERGRFLEDIVFSSVSYDAKAVYEIDSLKSRDVEKMFRQAYREFFFRPKQLGKMFNNLLHAKSIRTVFNSIRDGLEIFSLGRLS